MSSIKTIDFISKLGDAYFVIYNTLNIMKTPKIKNHIVDTMTQGMDDLLLKYITKLDGTAIAKTELNVGAVREIRKQLVDSAAKKVADYEIIFLNQNLVMQCTIMEIFFLHILAIIIEVEPRTLIGLAQEKNVTLQQVISLKTYDAIIEQFKDKIFDNFSRQGIEDKFEIYNKVGIDIKKIFDFSSYTEEIQQRYKDYDIKNLINVFDKRHNIVHKNKLPLTTLEELESIKDFFERIIINLSTIVMNQYGILSDIQENLVNAGYSRENIPVRQHK